MTDIKLSELTTKGSAAGTADLFETTTGGQTRSVTGQNLVDMFGADNLAAVVDAGIARGNISALEDGVGTVDETHLSTAVQIKLNNTAPSNFSATTAPAITDDSPSYEIGSVWIDTVADVAYRCVSAPGTGNAVWINTTLDTGEIGTMATQDASAVNITGGVLSGISSANFSGDLHTEGSLIAGGAVTVAAQEKIALSSTNIVDVFLYDTSKDSDGGAWRGRCRHTSWYREPLNTATRGATRKFPKKALIVTETDTVTIYDATKADCPMWMVFDGTNSLNMISASGAHNNTSTVMENGILVVGNNTTGLFTLPFILDDDAERYQSSTKGKYKGYIGTRNSAEDYGSFDAAISIANTTANDVSITTLAGAEIAPATGLPYSTIAVATDGGVSIINPTGTAADVDKVVHLISSLTYSNVTSVGFTDTGIWFNCRESSSTGSPLYRMEYDSIPDASFTGTLRDNATRYYTGGDYPGGPKFAASLLADPTVNITRACGGTGGLTLLDGDVSAYITTTYNTGWMQGDIQGCWLADSVAQTITGTAAIPDRSVKGNGLAVHGSITAASVATGADTVAYSGFSATNYLEQPYNPDLDFGTGDFCVMGWVKTGNNNGQTILERDSFTPAQGINVGIHAGGQLTFTLDDNTTTRIAAGTTSVEDNRWHMFCAVRSGGSQTIYLDGRQDGQKTGAALNTLHNANAVMRVGLSISGTAALDGNSKISRLRVCATAPTAEQITKIYNDEKWLYRENAQSTLDGTSNAVQALDYDAATDQLYVGTGDGTSVFRGLERIQYVDAGGTPTSDHIKAISATSEHFAIATAAEAVLLKEEEEL